MKLFSIGMFDWSSIVSPAAVLRLGRMRISPHVNNDEAISIAWSRLQRAPAAWASHASQQARGQGTTQAPIAHFGAQNGSRAGSNPGAATPELCEMGSETSKKPLPGGPERNHPLLSAAQQIKAMLPA
jgi:hypothetical protein